MTPMVAETAQQSGTKRKSRWVQGVLGALLLGLTVCLGFYFRSDAFRESVRRKVVAELELVTGGRVEVESVRWNLFLLQFEAKGVTVHGREAPDQAPLLYIDRVLGRATITSFYAHDIGLRLLVIDRPVLHLILYSDGTTNQPMPKVPGQTGDSVQRLFDLAIRRLEVNGGELLLNDKKLPFDFAANRMLGGMSYAKAGKDYEGSLTIDSLAVRYSGLQLRGGLEFRFRMHPSQVEVQALNLKLDDSTIEASGTVANYIHPEIRIQCNASLDLKRVGGILRIPEFDGGRLDLKGALDYRNLWYEARGSVSARAAKWRETGWNFNSVDLSSPFLFTPDKIALPAIAARLFGGTAQGDFQILNWNSTASVGKTAEHGKLGLRVSAIQAPALAAAISTRHVPLDKINLAGTVSGQLTETWTGMIRDAGVQLKLAIDPPANPSPNQLPLTGNLDATYHRGTRILDVTGLSFATRGIRLNATGTLGSNAAQLKTAFNANDLHELEPVLAAWSSDAQVPFEVHGRASFNGMLFGRLNAISARGRVDLLDFDTWSGPVHTLAAQSEATRIHWDSMLADVIVTPSGVSAQNGQLNRGAMQMTFFGSVALKEGVFDAQTSVMNGSLQLQSADLEDLQKFADIRIPLTGVLNANIRAAGTLHNLRGSGSLSSTRLTVYGEPFTQFRSDISFLGQETDFNNILLAHNGAQLTGSAAVNPEGRFMRFDLHGTNIELANFRRLGSQGFPISGRVDFHASGSETRESPAIQAQLTVRKPAIRGETFGDLTASAETRAGSLVLHAATSFQNAAVHVDGELGLRDNLPGQVAIKFDPLDFEPLIGAYLGLSPTGRLIAQGTIQLNGPMASPRSLSMAANVDQLSADIENIKLRNAGPVRFSVQNREVHVDEFHLVGDQTDLSLHGDADFGDTQILNVRADGKAELKLLQTLDPNIRSSGSATLQMRVEGTVHAPRVHGRMEIVNGAISVGDLPNGLSQIHGRLIFAQDRLQIDSLKAHTGGGDLDLAGFIAYRGGLYFEVTATGNDIRIRYPPGLSSSISASLRYAGSAEASLISGNATLVRLAVDPRFDFAQYLAQARSTGRKGPANPFLENMRLDVHVVSPPELRVDTSLAKVAGDVDLRIRGTAANPAILGRVNIAEGNVSFNGTKYRLQRGDVTFSNPQIIQPIINVELAAHVRDFDITIGFHGPIDRLNITYSSEPPMSSSDIIALLAFGRTKQQDVYGNEPINNGPPTLTTSDTVLEQALTTASSSRVQKLFGVGSVKIDPQVIGPENNLGPRVTIEQQIQNNITLTYLTNVAQSSSEQVIQVEYNLTRSISILAVRDENGILTLEVRIKKRKR